MPKSFGTKARSRVNLGQKDFKNLLHITGYLESYPNTWDKSYAQEGIEKVLNFHLQLMFRLSVNRMDTKEEN